MGCMNGKSNDASIKNDHNKKNDIYNMKISQK